MNLAGRIVFECQSCKWHWIVRNQMVRNSFPYSIPQNCRSTQQMVDSTGTNRLIRFKWNKWETIQPNSDDWARFWSFWAVLGTEWGWLSRLNRYDPGLDSQPDQIWSLELMSAWLCWLFRFTGQNPSNSITNPTRSTVMGTVVGPGPRSRRNRASLRAPLGAWPRLTRAQLHIDRSFFISIRWNLETSRLVEMARNRVNRPPMKRIPSKEFKNLRNSSFKHLILFVDVTDEGNPCSRLNEVELGNLP